MQRILILGSSGAGKSTLSTALAGRLSLPLIHLDAEYWQPGWVEPPRAAWAERVAKLCARERWVMDGNYSGTLDARVQACDTAVLLDYPRLLCLARVMQRAIRFRGRTRPDLGAGCPEHLPDLKFLGWIWSYPRRSLPKVVQILRKHGHCKVIILKSPAATRAWLAQFPVTTVAP